jgi:hypothetical protein
MSVFSKILTRKIEDTAPVPLAPVGFYIFQVISDAAITVRGEFEIVEFQLRGVQAADDDSVDMAELTAFGGAKNVLVRKSILFPTDGEKEADILKAQNDLKRFLSDHLNIDPSLDFKTALSQVKGKTCLGQVGHRPDKQNPDVVYSELKKTMPVT